MHAPSTRLDDRASFAAWLVQPVESRIGVRLHQAGVIRQMPFGVLAAAVGGIEEGRGRRIASAKGPVIAHIDPQSPRARLALGQHRYGGVVGMDALGREPMLWIASTSGISVAEDYPFRLERMGPHGEVGHVLVYADDLILARAAFTSAAPRVRYWRQGKVSQPPTGTQTADYVGRNLEHFGGE